MSRRCRCAPLSEAFPLSQTCVHCDRYQDRHWRRQNTPGPHCRRSAGVSVDTSLWTASPISGGPGVEGKAGRKESTEWDSSSPFVFAFSVSRVWASKATGQVVGEEQYRKGAMLGDDAEEGGQEEGDRVSIAKIEQVDAQAEGLDAEELMEDEDTVLCIRPKEEDSSD